MNLHSFSSRGSSICRSLFLRTFMVMMLFITGSNGIYAGVDKTATLPTTQAGNGDWTWYPSQNKYSWTSQWNNLMTIFTGLEGKLNTDYVALKFTTSDYTSQYRICFKDVNDKTLATHTLESAGETTIKLSELKFDSGNLSQVDKILFGGNSGSGSITLDPNSIVLVGQSKVTISPNVANKGTVYFTVGNDATQYTSTTVPNHTSVKFYANPNNEKVVFTGWGGNGEGRYVNPTEVKDVTTDLNFIAKFEDGIHIKCTVDPSNAAEPVVYQKGHPEWGIPSDGYVAPKQATTFAFKNKQERYKFLGWYDETDNELTKETTYTVDNVNAETKVIAKFSADIQNRTQRYALSEFQAITNFSNVLSAAYDANEKALVVKTKDQFGNYFPLYSKLNGTNSTGVRLHAKGVKFRILAKTSDTEKNTFKVNVSESNGYVTNHYKWEDFVNQTSGAKMTKDDVAKITQIGLAGDNANGETDKVFYVKDFWLDDIADYNKTIPCYGYEGGRKDEANNSFVYTTDEATAVFEGNNDDRDANQNIMLNADKDLKLSLSSGVSKFTEVCLVFGKETTYNLTVAEKKYTGTSTAVICPVGASELTIHNNSSSAISLAKIIYSSKKVGINEEREITVDGKTRRYWLYVPASVAGRENVPVVFSLHGRYNNDNPNDGGKPVFTSLANEKGFIVVYPQGRNAGDAQDIKDYPGDDWKKGFGGNTGWEATGKENADTKFIKALVDQIQSDYKTQNASNSNISVDPKRFYLCGFSMGGMMTYACAKVLNGTFAAYGSCGGFPLNEFHMNLATENPIPFIHLHSKDDAMVDIKLLHTIIENLLFRNGCKLSKQNNDDGWTTTTGNGITRNDFKGVNGVPVTTVTFDTYGHSVQPSAPAYLWDFFSNNTVGQYDSKIEWKWDMPTINANISNSSSDSYYGWKHEINGTDRSLTYGGKDNNEGNHNVYNSIQLTAGKHTLYAKMASTKGESSVTLRNILTGVETVARKVVDNSGTQDATDYNVLYEFEVGEGAEFSLELKRSDTNSSCTLLEIHKGSYRLQGENDDSQDNASINLTDGKLAELTFEKDEKDGVDIYPTTEKYIENNIEKYKVDNSSDNGNMKLYLISRLGIKNGKIDKKDKYIVEDPVFGHYFQNIPDADIYDRYGASDYMRVVLGDNNSLSGHKDKDGKDIDGIQKTGKVTIGFWVIGDIAVNRGLAYNEPSMFYIAGETYNGPNKVDNPHMFNITCSGGLTGYMKAGDGTFEYHSGVSSFGGLCPGDRGVFYDKNFYIDCNWHYITYQMYDNLSRYNMYVDGEPTCLGGYATHKAQSLDECIKGLKSIVLGGANANSVKFAYDVAFAYDDIVIYNRVLSKREINEIIKKKNYSPSVWHFDRNLGNNLFFNPENLNKNIWTSSNGVYTLNSNFTSAAALTYDGITEIPAFKGLRFVTDGVKKITIDAKSGALHLSKGVNVVFSNLALDTYVRMEYKNFGGWKGAEITNMGINVSLPSPTEGCERHAFKVTTAVVEAEKSITMPSDIDIIRMEATNKYFAQIKFVNKTTNDVVSVVKNPTNDEIPRLDLYINAVERLNNKNPETNHKFKYSSSSPHVASIDDNGNVDLKGIAGSTVITAELINDKNLYDCDIYDQYAFEPSNRIFSSYEIVVEPKEKTFYKVADGQSYKVGQTLYNGDKTVGVTLGGWTYNDGSYYVNYQDSYSAKESWEGQKFVKNANRKGYLANSRKTEENVFHEFFNDAKETFSTNGSFAAKSEQLTEDYAATGNYSAPAENKSVANATPWLLPCRGSHIKIEPTDAGLISVYVMQEGCVSHAPSGGTDVGGDHYDADEPIDITVKKVYVADEKGEIVKEVVADTKSKVAAQMWKDDGRARAEYSWWVPETAYNKATRVSFLKIDNFDYQWSFLDNWPNPGMQQHVFKLGNDEDGHVLITKGIVRYTFNVLPGKTYYIFSNTAKLGLAGFTFEKGKHAKYNMVQVDAKHKECRATGVFDVPQDKDVTLEDDGTAYSARTEKNAEVTLKRTFYKNYWNAICLPYSINRRQIEEKFGDGTMVVLMNNINTSTKKVMFIEHVNQDIIAGYPYLIFPTDKTDNDKTNHDPITGITTRATFGEANSPLFSVGTDGITYTSSDMQKNALVFKGTFSKEELPVGSYVITKSGTLANVPQTGLTINPYRAYIHFNKTTSGAKAIKLASMGFAGFDDMEGETTSIEDLLFNDGIMTRPADVFTVNGQKVRSKAENLYGLPKGVYIVNGKKYVNK